MSDTTGRMGCIYRIKNLVTGRSYIGQTVRKNPTARWTQHKTTAASPKGYKGPLHKDIAALGPDNFSFEVVEHVPVAQLNDREIYYIRTERTHVSHKGYNMTWGGRACGSGPDHPRYGKPCPDYVKQRVSEANKGKPRPEHLRRQVSEKLRGPRNHNFGKPMPSATREKISTSLRGEKHPNYGKCGPQHNRFGSKLTEEQRSHISSVTKGANNPRFGAIVTAETRRKISEAAKERARARGFIPPAPKPTLSPEERRLNHPLRGRKRSDAERAAMRAGWDKRRSKLAMENVIL